MVFLAGVAMVAIMEGQAKEVLEVTELHSPEQHPLETVVKEEMDQTKYTRLEQEGMGALCSWVRIPTFLLPPREGTVAQGAMEVEGGMEERLDFLIPPMYLPLELLEYKERMAAMQDMEVKVVVVEMQVTQVRELSQFILPRLEMAAKEAILVFQCRVKMALLVGMVRLIRHYLEGQVALVATVEVEETEVMEGIVVPASLVVVIMEMVEMEHKVVLEVWEGPEDKVGQVPLGVIIQLTVQTEVLEELAE